jgi:hypothetical protein
VPAVRNRRTRFGRVLTCGLSVALIAVACDGGDDDESASTTAPATSGTLATVAPTEAPTTAPPSSVASTAPTSAPPTTTGESSVASTDTTAPDATATDDDAPTFDVVDIVGRLSSDEFGGRDDGTDGWRLAQEFLAGQLASIAEPAFPDAEGPAGYIQTGASANVLGIIPGGDLADEFVVIGAHYDGLGDGTPDCRVLDPSDTICNGAADDATGVAAVLAVAHHIVATGTPRRSVLIGLWDREEDGLLGSQDFLLDPVVPVAQMVAYMNFDIQGANLLPSLRETTVMVGAETGGAPLVTAAMQATEASALSTAPLSLVFGQGRSDHANFVGAGVPSVFFTDANNGCYHTTRDDIAAVDFAKLDQQIAIAVALADELVSTDQPPTFVPDAPVATYEDAIVMLQIVQLGQVDFDLVTGVDRATLDQYVADLQAIVEAGEAAFDDADVGPLLGGAAMLVEALSQTECDGYIAEGG